MALRDELIASGKIRPQGIAKNASTPSLSQTDGLLLEPLTTVGQAAINLDPPPIAEETIGVEDVSWVSTTPQLTNASKNIPSNAYFKDVDELRTTLLTLTPSDFVSKYVFESVPFVFSDSQSWIAWKTELAHHLQVDSREIVLAGSGSMGFSLNPKKELRAFDNKSDLDIGVISRHHFEVAWWTLRRYNPLFGAANSKRTRAFKLHRASYIFDGSVATDQVLSLLPFGVEWQTALEKMSTVEPTVGRELKIRIYRDFESLRSYQMGSIKRLRTLLAPSDEPDESPIHEEIEKNEHV